MAKKIYINPDELWPHYVLTPDGYEVEISDEDYEVLAKTIAQYFEWQKKLEKLMIEAIKRG